MTLLTGMSVSTQYVPGPFLKHFNKLSRWTLMIGFMAISCFQKTDGFLMNLPDLVIAFQ